MRFTPEEPSLACLTIITNDDQVLESDEVFDFQLQTSDRGISAIQQSSGQIIIDNDDGEFILYPYYSEYSLIVAIF